MSSLIARVGNIFFAGEEDSEPIVLSNPELADAAIEAAKRAEKGDLNDEDVAIFLKCR